MSIIRKIFSWFQSKFGLEPVKRLHSPNLQELNLQELKLQETNKQELNSQEAKIQQPTFAIKPYNKEIFIKSLKIKRTNKKIETLICYGDGLGIQKKLSC